MIHNIRVSVCHDGNNIRPMVGAMDACAMNTIRCMDSRFIV